MYSSVVAICFTLLLRTSSSEDHETSRGAFRFGCVIPYFHSSTCIEYHLPNRQPFLYHLSPGWLVCEVEPIQLRNTLDWSAVKINFAKHHTSNNHCFFFPSSEFKKVCLRLPGSVTGICPCSLKGCRAQLVTVPRGRLVLPNTYLGGASLPSCAHTTGSTCTTKCLRCPLQNRSVIMKM